MNDVIINTSNLIKRYRRYKKREGIYGSIASLWKRDYEDKIAINQIDLSVNNGECIGLIGPNGAGKTTLIKMLTGIIAPTEGSIDVIGYYPNDLKNEFKKQYAVVMGQKSQLFFELTANDTLCLFKEIYEIPEEDFQKNKSYFVELFGVRELMDVQVRTLSLGERMKMELIVSLIHNPKVLFLDEPTIGLDAVASRQIRRFLKEINEKKGTTIILTSHYMEDIKALCKRTVVINHGSKIYDGLTEELFERYQKNKKILITFHEPVENIALKTKNATIVENHSYKKVYEVPKQFAKDLVAEVMKYEPEDIVVEDEEIGAIVERIYQEGSECHGQIS
ncbi:MAG: ATP-binding cassette domain-containing protein [Eubacterium sp.]|nr:ATP-binding cassette domain-containing protein [Eubacterium sp.]